MPNTKQLRSFGWTVGGAFLIVSTWPLIRRGEDPHFWLLALGSALLLLGLLMPNLLRQPFQVWMRIAHVLGWINTKIILGVMFYTVFTPAAFIVRLIGKDPMNRAFIPNANTYRVLRQPRGASHMKHQF